MEETTGVTVSRGAFLAAIKPLRRFVRKKDPGEAIISMVGEELSISAVGVAIGMPAFGRWKGEVRIPSRFLLALARTPPGGDPIRIEVDGDRLRIGSVSISCSISDGWKSEIPLPLDPPLFDILVLPYQYGADRIEKAGLTKRVAEAEAHVMKKLEAAAEILAPLGIGVSDLEKLWVDHIKKRAKV